MERGEVTLNYYKLMDKCIELAENTSNEMYNLHTGSLIWLDGEIVAEGWKTFIEPTKMTMHAERHALDRIVGRASLSEAYLFTTLEPCVPNRSRRNTIFHSCCEYIVKSGIGNVVIGQKDDSPIVNGSSGIKYLESNKEIAKTCYPQGKPQSIYRKFF